MYRWQWKKEENRFSALQALQAHSQNGFKLLNIHGNIQVKEMLGKYARCGGLSANSGCIASKIIRREIIINIIKTAKWNVRLHWLRKFGRQMEQERLSYYAKFTTSNFLAIQA
jgi:hypothetical protein